MRISEGRILVNSSQKTSIRKKKIIFTVFENLKVLASLWSYIIPKYRLHRSWSHSPNQSHWFPTSSRNPTVAFHHVKQQAMYLVLLYSPVFSEVDIIGGNKSLLIILPVFAGLGLLSSWFPRKQERRKGITVFVWEPWGDKPSCSIYRLRALFGKQRGEWFFFFFFSPGAHWVPKPRPEH